MVAFPAKGKRSVKIIGHTFKNPKTFYKIYGSFHRMLYYYKSVFYQKNLLSHVLPARFTSL